MSPTQRHALKRLANGNGCDWNGYWSYMPWVSEQRTYDALERMGLIEYRGIGEPGVTYAGYRITEKGLKCCT